MPEEKRVYGTVFTLAAACAALLTFGACSSNPAPSNNQTAASNANAQPANTAPAKTTPLGITASPTSAGRAEQGEPVDTSKQDAEIKRLEAALKKKPDDEATKKALANAYFERAEALKGARQYKPALGDYRRTLRYDPEHAEARQWAQTIVVILQQMGRDVPPEGAEPTPLPMKKK